MKKYLMGCIIFLTLSLFTSSVCNAESEYISNFNKKYTYTQNQFIDVNSEWFAPAVRQAYETGLMNGNSKNTFNPNGNIDNAAVITIAARLHSIYNYGTDEFKTNASNWYEPYIDYAVSKGICDSGIDMNAIATRGFFAGIIGNSIDTNIFSQKNVIEKGALSDVTGWYSNAVYTFYRAGVLSGNDEYGTFAPDTPITRAEVAAILSRIVRPSERVSVELKSRPIGTYSIMQDDGSLEAFKQRALVANFKVLIGGEAKSSDWENDKYYINHLGTAGIPSKTVIIPEEYIDSRYSDSYDDYVITFKNSWVEADLPGETTIPIYYFEYNRSCQIGDKSYNLSVVNTGGEVDFYGGIIINGDLKLYYPGKAGTESWTETITYNNYTAEAQRMINSVEYTRPIIDENKVRAYLNNIYGKGKIDNYKSKICVGYLTDLENCWYITMNIENMYQPSSRQGQLNRLTQKEYCFAPTEEKTIQWCKKNYGNCVLALVNTDFKSPLMLAEISGYTDSKETAEIWAWDYTNGALNIKWKESEISFENQLIIVNSNGESEVSDTTGLKRIVKSGEQQYFDDYLGERQYFVNYSDEGQYFDYYLGGGWYNDDYSGGEWCFNDYYEAEYEFFVRVENDEITIVSDRMYSRDAIPLSRFVRFSLNSDTAIVGELRPHYGGTNLDDYDNIITQKKVSVTIKPKIINGDIYLPAKFLIENLY